MTESKGTIFRIKRFSLHDGPGIRTAVFLKGCPLKCIWCHNPEGLTNEIATWHNSNTCISCGMCIASCIHKALEQTGEGRIEIDRSLCRNERNCVKACPTGSMQSDGDITSADKVLEEILKDSQWYETAGGGVTLTGGEPLFQPAFAAEILRRCRQNNINTALETCLYAPWSDLQSVIGLLDTIIVDMKIADPVRHRIYSGVSNDLIRENFIRLASEDIPIVVRIPIVPGITDSEQNISEIRNFIHKINKEIPVELIPFNPLARNNYDRLGLPFLF